MSISPKQLKELDHPSKIAESEGLSDIQKKILAELESEQGLTAIILSKRLNLSRQLIRYNLRRLSEMKLIAPQFTNVGIRYYTSSPV